MDLCTGGGGESFKVTSLQGAVRGKDGAAALFIMGVGLTDDDCEIVRAAEGMDQLHNKYTRAQKKGLVLWE